MMLQHNIAISLHLTDTWFRKYQVLKKQMHPQLTMSQKGEYLLMGTKLCPCTGMNKLDESTVHELWAKLRV